VVAARLRNSSSQSRRFKAFIPIADLLIVALMAFGLAALYAGPYRFTIFSIRVSVSSPWRPFLIALVLAAVRAFLDPRPPRLGQVGASARDPLPLGEAQLSGPFAGAPFRQRAIELLAVAAGFTVLTAAFTWPQVTRMDGVPDLGDPLF
jgi:hypothetical protein